MIGNYLTIAWRNVKKYRVFSTINIAGLTIGLCAFWVIALYIADELSYDRYNKNADRIFRVVHYGEWSGGSFKLVPTAVPFAPALKADYPEIKDAMRIDAEGGGTLTVGAKKIKADDILFTDNSIFNIFSYHFLSGDAKTALATPQSIVLTKTLAEKLFGSAENALNKVVYFDKNFTNTVTGVISDVPTYSHFTFSALRSFPANFNDGWGNFYVYTYVLLNKSSDYKSLQAKLPGFYNKHLKESLGSDVKYRMELQPLTSIHLHSNLDYELSANGDIKYIYIFSVIGLLVLIIAVINYVNLSTARSSIRVKEIGVRKVVGSGKKQLVAMFLAESVLLTFIAGVCACAITALILPYFNIVTGKTLNLWQFGKANTVAALFLFSLVTGIASGIYPALFLSSFRTIPALKGQTGSQGSNIFFRKVLVTFQFVITIALIAGSGIIYQQLQYTMNKDLGFNKNQTLSFHISNHSVRQQVPALKQQLLKNPLIQAAAAASNPIGNNNIGTNGFNYELEAAKPGEQGKMSTSAKMAQDFMMDEDFVNTLQLKVKQGRNFSVNTPADKYTAVMVNETLVKEFGWKNPIGKKIQVDMPAEKNVKEVSVIGVVKDFNIYSLQHKIEPLILFLPPVANEEDNMYVRLSGSNIPAAIQYIKDTYKKFDAESDLDYSFLDANFARQYQSEQLQGNLIFTFTILAIFISCLGLLGLVTFAASQRTKEIGIRKVVGATVPSIVFMLSKDFVKLVVLAIIIATPIAWYALNKWLENFAYRVNISWVTFAVAGAIALLVALITVSIQAIKAAKANPVKSLKME